MKKYFVVESAIVLIILAALGGFIPWLYEYRHALSIVAAGYLLWVRQKNKQSFTIPLKKPCPIQWKSFLITNGVFLIIILGIYRYVPHILSQSIHPTLNLTLPPNTILILYVLLSVPIQELIFRWLYIEHLEQKNMSPEFIAVWSSIVFGLVHLSVSYMMVVGTAILGYIWAKNYQHFRNLTPVMISHTILGCIIIYFTLH